MNIEIASKPATGVIDLIAFMVGLVVQLSLTFPIWFLIHDWLGPFWKFFDCPPAPQICKTFSKFTGAFSAAQGSFDRIILLQ